MECDLLEVCLLMEAIKRLWWAFYLLLEKKVMNPKQLLKQAPYMAATSNNLSGQLLSLHVSFLLYRLCRPQPVQPLPAKSLFYP